MATQSEPTPVVPNELWHPAFGRCVGDPTRAAVQWRPGVDAETKDALLRELGLTHASAGAGTDGERRPLLHVNRTDALSWVQGADGGALDGAQLQRLNASPLVEWVSPAWRADAATREVPALFAVNPTRIYVKRGAVDAAGGVAKLGASTPLDVAPDRLRGYVTLRVDGAIGAAREIGAGVAPGDVRFENIPYLSPECHVVTAPTPTTDPLHGPYRPDAGRCRPPTSELTPSDPEFAIQWGLQRINAPRGWQIARGSPSVTVAVLDEGIELAHPDLDVHPQSWNASTDTPNGGPTGNHGTACAGIIGARLDNALGVAGVAGGVRTMAIATATWADADIVEGLYFAADHGARVVSMSFGVYASWMMWDFAIIQDALQYAHDKGLVLVAATGNENGPVSRFPGSDARTIGAGGSNRSDERKRIGDSSSEAWWGASYGPDIDVVAPCLEIPTTDRFGAAGYAGGDYYDFFNGTSSATPHVAGLAGLLVSLRPNLTNVETRQLIESTCDKISPATYAYANVGTKPSGTWNAEVGYGRINVERALLAACALGRAAAERECSGCGGECIEPTPEECRGPEPIPWLSRERCMMFYESRVFDEGRIQIRVTYEHCLRLLGRQQGPLLYTQTLLPGEQVRLYTFDRYRRVKSHTEQLSVHASFRQTVSALSQSRRATSASSYTDFLTKARSETDSSLSVGGGLAGFFGAPSGSIDKSDVSETTLATGGSVSSVSEQFTQFAITASQSLEAERGVVVSTFEDAEHVSTTQRSFRNDNHCYAVTYYIRRVNELYDVTTHVISVEWRAGNQGPFRAVNDVAGVNDEIRKRLQQSLGDAPLPGEQKTDHHLVTIPTDGLLYETELAHCSSCEPTREAEERMRLERLRQENRRMCIENRALSLELERQRALLKAGQLDHMELPRASQAAALPAADVHVLPSTPELRALPGA
ncbi:peptidase S8 and S53 subtilisin kexin sedolisin [Gemmatirosa kalamazoonensis]|uniref:Peptidase S8 and S53 subtilisin kexin sedolisin n=1 Tax=Gemmatirosa kalamazoonensis TaxID=861299 RepID=W0REA0_9BACT|nr:S8 family serine peptidase [Gemmatirosa kalamazoonensis]AHG88660.1 peptidase S8 and S53 subtilisin kexin sedolisin [Gemmatirosa kalamazoonensis]